jgi:hypothetical protein
LDTKAQLLVNKLEDPKKGESVTSAEKQKKAPFANQENKKMATKSFVVQNGLKKVSSIGNFKARKLI